MILFYFMYNYNKQFKNVLQEIWKFTKKRFHQHQQVIVSSFYIMSNIDIILDFVDKFGKDDLNIN